MHPAPLISALLWTLFALEAPGLPLQVGSEKDARIREAVLQFVELPGNGFVGSPAVEGALRIYCEEGLASPENALHLAEPILWKLQRALGTAADGPLAQPVGVVVGDRDLYRSLCEAAAAIPSRNSAFLLESRTGSGFVLYEAQVVVILQGRSDPEIQANHALIHGIVHLECYRRFGLLPLWLTEGLACAGEEAGDGLVRANWYRSGLVQQEEQADWRGARTTKVVLDPELDIEELYGCTARPYRDRMARLAFALAVYGLETRPDSLRRFCDSLAALRNQTWGGGPFYDPGAKEVADLVREVFGEDLEADLQAWWRTQDQTVVLQGSLARAATSFLEEKATRMKVHASQDRRLLLYSDLSATTAKRSLKLATSALERLDLALGRPVRPAAASLLAIVIKDRQVFRRLCDALAKADPARAGFLRQQKDGHGFLLKDSRIVVHLLAPRDHNCPDHCLVHDLAHLECHRRFEQISSWIEEGLACAAEEGVTGEVSVNCHRSEETCSADRRDWRGRRTRQIVQEAAPGLDGLFGYSASDYDDDLAHLAFAVVAYGLEADPRGLARFCHVIARESRLSAVSGGSCPPAPGAVQRLAAEAFGSGFEADLREYWKEPPTRKRATVRMQRFSQEIN